MKKHLELVREIVADLDVVADLQSLPDVISAKVKTTIEIKCIHVYMDVKLDNKRGMGILVVLSEWTLEHAKSMKEEVIRDNIRRGIANMKECIDSLRTGNGKSI